ncbi:hypothetical protein PISMIDRAFT_12317 [Pisolithus microcarpus 441]|uniref:Uncharacterized protein n=1 Tax=Pisolithus microcarpus 441 TaxID=765257 RepID=A0A0C9Z5H0_9AGAM|nr:hypothetical protein BKA83DRAFT_12317 [Pisolithus microcarpus]KAI6036794.1 hypothetical protein BKA83DRAFT_4623246 [Pisolithus microcarpus]KIK21384.1 hypothetical protein PISMIDRAFT_12317 [Pisolithus microcarpus 441]
MSVGMMSSLLTPNQPNGSLLTSSSPANTTFHSTFPLPHVPDGTFAPANEMPITSFPTFMTGAYSQETKQINLLQERTKLLEGEVVKLTVENSTLRTAFQCLAGAVGLRDMDPCKVDNTSFPPVALLKLKEEPAPPTPNEYPSIRFWDREDWDKYLESPEGQTSKRGTMGYLEDKDGNPPSCKTAKAIRKVLRGGWVELVNRELAPPSWGRLSASARQFVHGLMENAYPDFKFANNGWKLDYLASTTYPAWRKGSLDDNGKWKQKKGKGPKMEDDDDDDDSTNEVGMKRKGLGFKSEEPGSAKRFRGKYEEENDSTPPTSMASLSPPLSDTSVSSSEPSVESRPLGTSDGNEAPSYDTLCADAEKDSMHCGPNTVTKAISIDPLAALALAASKARDTPTLSLLDTSQEPPLGSGANETQSSTRPILELEHAIVPAATSLPSIPGMLDITTTPAPVSKSTKGNGKAKMRPGPTKNGRNLCAHRWRKQVQSSGSTEEFQQYYNGLTAEQRKAYDDDATALVASNNWDAKSICNGTLH